MLESIKVGVNASLKVEIYDNDHYCASAGWHIHPEYELVYVKNGTGQLNIAQKRWNYTNGILVFLGGNIPHGDFGNKEHHDNLEVVIQFKEEFLKEKLKVFPEMEDIKELIKKSNQVLVFHPGVHQSMNSYFEKFQHLDGQGKLINLLTILDGLSKNEGYETLHEHVPMGSFRNDEIRKLEEAFEYVNTQYANDISVSEIAFQLSLTPNSFCRFFKKMTQRTFIDFVNQFRIDKASEMFNDSNTSIAQVMYASGFNDPSYFSRQFKKYKGTTPSAYLKRKRKGLFLHNPSL